MGTESQTRATLSPQAQLAPVARDELDLPGIGAAIMRRKALIAGVTIACFLGALAFVTTVRPLYTADARLLIENQESYFTQPERGGAAQLAPDEHAVASQVQLLTSRDLGRQAIRQLGLAGNPEFDPLAGGQGLLSRMLMAAGIAPQLRQLAPEDRMLERYARRLTVYAIPKSRVVAVQFNSHDPALAARAANTIASLYIDVQQENKKDQARVAAMSLGELIGSLRKQLADAESKVEAFRGQSGLLMGANNALVPVQQLAEINAQMAAARTTMADAEARARSLRSMIENGRLDETLDVSRDELVRRIGEQRANLRNQIASESRTLGPAHPRMQELRARLTSAENELRAAALRVARGLENDARIASTRVDNLKAAIENQTQQVNATSSDQVRLRELELEAKLVREQLESNLVRYKEALARQQSLSTPGDARIISRAVEPQRPSFPKKLPIVIFATLAGMIMTLGCVVGTELLSGRAFVARPVASGAASQAPPVPPLRAVSGDPVSRFEDRAYRYPGRWGDALGGETRRLLAKLKAMDTQVYGRRILICPQTPLIDHATAAEGPVRALAADRRTVLIDLSGRLEPGQSGLAELLQGVASVSQVIQRDPGSRLHVIPRGWGEPDFGEDFDLILDALSQTYDFVVIMAPDQRGGQVALQLAPAVDVAIVMAGAAERETAAEAANADEAGVDIAQRLLAAGAGEAFLLPVEERDGLALEPEAA